MDWDGLTAFLQEIRVFLEQSKGATVDSLIEKCEFYISTSHKLKFNDEVDHPNPINNNNTETYLNMAQAIPIPTTSKMIIDDSDPMEQSEYIDMDEYHSPTKSIPTECPYTGLPAAHLKLNKNVIIIQENMKISGKKATVTCALLKGPWLLYYSKPSALKPTKFFMVCTLDVADHSLDLTLTCGDGTEQTLTFESGTVREMWIKAIRDELPKLEDGVYDDPNNLRMDDHLYKTLHFNYDIPKMPPKPVEQKVSPNRAEFSLKYQEIKEQLANQLKHQKSGNQETTTRPQRSNSVSPQKKFGKFISMFRTSSSTSTTTGSAANQEGSSGKKSPEKTAKIMKYKRNTTIFSPDYEIVGS